MRKSGVELIAEERQKQITKHGFTGKHHAEHPQWYDQNQLVFAANVLAQEDIAGYIHHPLNWDREWFLRLCERDYEERLAIAGALLAAELDRLEAIRELLITK